LGVENHCWPPTCHRFPPCLNLFARARVCVPANLQPPACIHVVVVHAHMHTSRLTSTTQTTVCISNSKRICPATIIAVTTRIGTAGSQNTARKQAGPRGVPRHQSSRSSSKTSTLSYAKARDLPAGCSAWHDETGYNHNDLGVLTGFGVSRHRWVLCTSPYCTWNERDQRVSTRVSESHFARRRSRKPKYTDAVNLSSVQVDLKYPKIWLPGMVIFSH
jgi:hypothetical protein